MSEIRSMVAYHIESGQNFEDAYLTHNGDVFITISPDRVISDIYDYRHGNDEIERYLNQQSICAESYRGLIVEACRGRQSKLYNFGFETSCGLMAGGLDSLVSLMDGRDLEFDRFDNFGIGDKLYWQSQNFFMRFGEFCRRRGENPGVFSRIRNQTEHKLGQYLSYLYRANENSKDPESYRVFKNRERGVAGALAYRYAFNVLGAYIMGHDFLLASKWKEQLYKFRAPMGL